MRFAAAIVTFVSTCLLSIPIALAKESSTFEYQLDNGLQVIVREDHRAPVVASMVWYKIGGSYEPLGLTGISHMLEHLMFKGTKQVPEDHFSQLLDQYGARQNAFTTADYTGYYEYLSSAYLPLSFALEADRMQNLSLLEKDFAKEKQVVIEERRLRVDDQPQSLTYERFQAMAYPGSPYANPVIGWPSDVRQLSLEDAKNWYKTWYAPNNAILVVVGDVKPQEVLALAKKHFGKIPKKNLPKIKPVSGVAEVGKRELTLKVQRASLPMLLMGFNTPVIKTAKQPWHPYALQVLAAILGGDQSTRLATNLVRKQELLTEAGASYAPFSRTNNLFTVYAVPNPSKKISLDQAQKAVWEQINALQAKAPSQEELQRVKIQLNSSMIYQRDSIFSQAQSIGSLASVGLPWQLADSELEKQINQVTAKQVQEVAKLYLTSLRLTTAKMLPAPSKLGGPKQPSSLSNSHRH